MEPSAQERAFAAEVDRCRAAARVSQDWVARRVGLSRPKVSEICGAHFLPSRQALDALITALAMDRDRTVGLWRAACDGKEERRQAETMAGRRPPEGWDALPVLPAQVHSLLRAQERAAEELPYRLPGARRPALATVYVRQELGADVVERRTEETYPEPTLDGREPPRRSVGPAPRSSVRPPARTLREALDADEHLLITGGPGQGKSTLSLRLAADIAQAWVTPAEDPPLAEPVVPLRLTARELARRLDLPFPQALAGSVGAEYGSLLRSEVSTSVLAERVAGCRWLLLVDALDEVADGAQRDRLVTVLAACASDPGGSPYRVVLTTRPVEGGSLAPLQRAATARYELQPFDEAALRRFAENWFAEEGSATADRFVRQLREAHLNEIVQVPLLATIAAIVFEKSGDRPLPDNRYELYHSYLDLLRSARPSVPRWLEHLRVGLLEHLGLVRLETDTSLTSAARDWVAERIDPDARPADWEGELVAFLTAVGPLVIRGDDLQFLHHSFAEHLAATAKARLLPAVFDPEQDGFARLLHAARADEPGRHARAVLLHYTRLHPAEADPLVQWLHGGLLDEQLLAARLLARHVPASPEAVDGFLATVRSWAMTTHFCAVELLQRTSRAAHHPGLVPWLADLMRDAAAPWESRIQAAVALATRLRPFEAEEATGVLRAVVADIAVPIAERLVAAEGLAECGSSEREAAKNALTALLADPSASAYRRRTAAVVLAGLGPQARTAAVDALSETLDDPWSPTIDLVEAATGLAEIDAEYHSRSAEVFRSVLCSGVHTMVGVRSAADGLAALGHRHRSDAVTALTALICDRGRRRFDRCSAAETLAELGPQYRPMAGAHVLDILTEPGLRSHERWKCAAALVRIDAELHVPAAEHLRHVITDRNAGSNSTVWALQELVDLGPDFHPEAAQGSLSVAADPLAGHLDHARALGNLAKLGAPHRAPALDRLRTRLIDRNAEPEARYWAASELLDLGVEFHAEVSAALLEIISGHPDTKTVSQACAKLSTIGTRFHVPVASMLLTVLQSSAMDPSTMAIAAHALAALGEEQQQRAAGALADVIADEARSAWSRGSAARQLSNLRGQFDAAAVGGFIGLLQGDSAPDLVLDEEITGFPAIGIGPRERLAEVVRALMYAPNTGPERVRQAAHALVGLGLGDAPDVVAALRTVAIDVSADLSTRRGAAVALASLGPEHHAEAVAALRRVVGSNPGPWTWRSAVLDLALFGGDAVPLARALLADQDASRMLREAAALVLPQLRVDLIGEAVTELRSQAHDDHLELRQRTEVILALADLDPSTRDDAIAFHQRIVDEEDENLDVRCSAAYQLVQLDRRRWMSAVDALRRWSTHPLATIEHQAAVTRWLTRLNALRPGEAGRSALAVHHPACPPRVRQRIITVLFGPCAFDAQRALTADLTAPASVRVPGAVHKWHQPLVEEAEAALRDVLTAVESTYDERVNAAAALAALSPRLIPDAVHALESLSRGDGPGASRALREMARPDGNGRSTALAIAQAVVSDESLPQRQRHRAADIIIEIDPEPKPAVLNFLRDVASDKQTADLRRVDALAALRPTDGLAPLRAVRDDERALPAARCLAAVRLIDYSIDDRAESARVLGLIACDSTARPALRWQVAEDLAQLGRRGGNRAADALRSIATDSDLPITARAGAARLLAEIRPRCTEEALTILRALAGTDRPLHRRLVLLALGSLDTIEAVPPLRAMAQDRALSPLVRLRCAEALVELRRDQRETAAMVARELMHDHRVPTHVRMRAARHLARWSELCRAEARNLLRVLGHRPPEERPRESR